MRKYFYFIFLIAVFLIPGCEEKHSSTDEFREHLNLKIPKLMERYNIPGVVVAVVEKGGPAWEKAYGYSDLTEKRKMKENDVCMVHSISKSVTSWGVIKLVDKGRLELDKPVGAYFKDGDLFLKYSQLKKITVRQLLSNSSGLGLGTVGVHYFPSEKRPELKDVLAEEMKPVSNPGSEFIYSNQGFNLLELIVEEVTGQDFAQYMNEEVLKPLGMEHSGFDYSPERFPYVPKGYKINGEEIPVYLYAGNASGGLFSTVGDIAKFASASMPEFNERGLSVLRKSSIEEIRRPQIEMSGLFSAVFDAYGFGHFTEILPNGMKAVSHGGQGLGWMTHFFFVPETGDGIVIFTNSQRSWPMFSEILNDWAQFNRFDSVGMGIIEKAVIAVWIIINIIMFLSCLLFFRLLYGIFSGRKKFDPLSKRSLGRRIIQLVLSVNIFFILIWCINQDYLFITSIFPAATPVLAYSSLFSATVMLILVLFPGTSETLSRKRV